MVTDGKLSTVNNLQKTWENTLYNLGVEVFYAARNKKNT